MSSASSTLSIDEFKSKFVVSSMKVVHWSGGKTAATYSDAHHQTIEDVDTILRPCLSLFNEFIPNLRELNEADALTHVKRVFAAEPISLIVAAQLNPISVYGVAIYRQYQNTYNGSKFHIEGMYVRPNCRSAGIGKVLMTELKSIAKAAGSNKVVTQVLTESFDAHRFFMRERCIIQAFAFIGSAESVPSRFQPVASPLAVLSASPPLVSPSPSLSPSPSPTSPPPSTFDVRMITDEDGQVSSSALVLLAAAESTHRQLRPDLPAGRYIERMKEVFATGGRMIVAVQRTSSSSATFDSDFTPSSKPIVLGLCVYRFYYDFVLNKKRNWVDDLVTDGHMRSTGVGHGLLDFVRNETRRHGVSHIQLDSGQQRKQAHKFYFRENMIIDAYSFGVEV